MVPINNSVTYWNYIKMINFGYFNCVLVIPWHIEKQKQEEKIKFNWFPILRVSKLFVCVCMCMQTQTIMQISKCIQALKISLNSSRQNILLLLWVSSSLLLCVQVKCVCMCGSALLIYFFFWFLLVLAIILLSWVHHRYSPCTIQFYYHIHIDDKRNTPHPWEFGERLLLYTMFTHTHTQVWEKSIFNRKVLIKKKKN